MKTIQFNKERLRDKIYGAFIGKNIGGTIGAPFEGKREYLDVKGFSTKVGEIIPNDDLDLQLMWLFAMEEEGPFNFDEKVLAEYWSIGIDPIWNEYGRCKANLADGIMPPLSGAINNDWWKTSNGAWIRSEIWATLTPGLPSFTRRYAFYDACVDHGISEGTFAEIFTATIESMAFFNDDIRYIIEEGMKQIPKTSCTYNAIQLVLNEFDKGTDRRVVRDILVKQSEDIGWFQAPANIGFVVLGLLYGQGDYKNSILYAVNCGDDTDCTGATVGAFLGILLGYKNLPSDWVNHVGDGIEQDCLNRMFKHKVPKSCTELTDRILKLLPIVLYANDFDLVWGDSDVFPTDYIKYYTPNELNVDELESRSEYSFSIPNVPYAVGYAEYDKAPILKEGENIKLRLKLTCNTVTTFNFNVKAILPDGWNLDYPKSFNMALEEHWNTLDNFKGPAVWESTLTVGEKMDAINHVYVVLSNNVNPQPIIVDFIIKG